MFGLGGAELLVLVVLYLGQFALIGLPVMWIAQRAGFSGWWAVLAPVPPFSLILLWVFAFIAWPTVPREG